MRIPLVLALSMASACAHADAIGPHPASANHPRPANVVTLGELPVRTGERVRVTIAGGSVVGRVRRLSSGAIAIARGKELHTFRCDQVAQIDRPADGLANGALIGAALAALGVGNACQNKGSNVPCVAATIGAFAGLGALIDRSHSNAATLFIAGPEACAPGRGLACEVAAADPGSAIGRQVTCQLTLVSRAANRSADGAPPRRTYLAGKGSGGRPYVVIVDEWLEGSGEVTVQGYVAGASQISLTLDGRLQAVHGLVLTEVSVRPPDPPPSPQ